MRLRCGTILAAVTVAVAANAETIFEAKGLVTDKTPGFRFGNVTFTDNDGIREINKEYRDIDKETDVLSFPMTDEGEEFTVNPETGCKMLGDIVISVEKALAQAEEYGHGFKREIAFLTVHSMLHLLGYDHEKSEEEEKEMFGKQEIVLEALGLGR